MIWNKLSMGRALRIAVGITALAVLFTGEVHANETSKSDNHFFPDGTNVTTKVLVIDFDPIIESHASQRLHHILGWNDPHELAQDYINDLGEASGNFVNYQIVQWIDADVYPKKIDGFQYTDDTYLAAWNNGGPWHDPDIADYYQILADYNITARVASGEIDEVFMFGGPYFGFYESRMAGPDAYDVNSPAMPDVPSGRLFVLMGFSYERHVGEMLEDFGHRTESIMTHVYGSWNSFNPKHNWDNFTMYEMIAPGNASCGNIHYAPNAIKAEDAYDYGNPNYVWSTCDDWLYNWPSLNGSKKWVNGSEWGGGDSRLYFKWWFKHIPNKPGINPDGKQNNWWKYLVDFNNYPESGGPTLIDSCAIISSPGEYVLNQSIIDSSATVCINITSSDVVFDGADYKIDGNGTWDTYGMYVYNPANDLTNITVKNLKLTDWRIGIYYINVTNGGITNSTVTSYDGITLRDSSNNILINNTVIFSVGGFSLYSSSNNTLIKNNGSSNLHGVILYESNNNILINNTVSWNSGHGFSFGSSNSNNVLRENTALNNNYGIYIGFSSSSKNVIYNNYFNNTNNAWDNGNNIWNTTKTSGMNIIGGPYLGGNYWSDYAGSDLDVDGLGDTQLPYNSSGNITNGGDFLPLTITPTPTAGGISGYKINDTNGNGKWDAGEKGISKWTIRLIGIIGKGKDSSVIRKDIFTDAMGFYKFDSLSAGRYFVIEKLKKGFVPTNSTVKRIKLAQGENSMNNNFTNRPAHRLDKIDGQRVVDDYEVINRDIDKYKEEMD